MPINAALVGAGQRGHHTYGRYALDHPDDLRFVAVVDPDPQRRDRFGEAHAIPGAARHATTDPLFAHGSIVDVCVIASPDGSHLADARAAITAGCHVLLEKPIASSLEATVELVRLANRSNRVVQIAHVLRYTPFFRTLHEVLSSGRLGDIVTVEHRENVAAWHMAHSFVRGNWAKAAASSPMIVQKCSHDFDILTWNLDSPVTRLSSIGSLFHFRPDRRPAGATDRCIDDCPVVDCPFDARPIYLNQNTGWPVNVVTDDFSRAGREAALHNGPYGRCVYTAGSDVVDHQIVMMELASGASCVLVMHGHSHEEQRTMRYDGTRATLRAVFGRVQRIAVVDHAAGKTEEVPIPAAGGDHGGGDPVLIGSFLAAVRGEAPAPTTPQSSLESHYLAFAAEQARLEGDWIEMASLRRSHAP